MKVKCSISSIEFKLDEFQDLNSIPTFPHPMFKLTLKQLRRITTNLNQKEKSLLLLAKLNHFPDLIKFKSCINYQVIKLSVLEIPNLTNQLIQFQKHNRLVSQLPKFNLTNDSINSLGQYLKDCLSAIEEHSIESASRISQRTKRQELRRKQEFLIKRNSKQFSSRLTQWLFESIEFPKINITGANRKAKNGKYYETLESYWKDLFKEIAKSPSKVFSYPKADLDSLIEFILETLENECPNSLLVYTILREAEKEYHSITLDLPSMEVSIGQSKKKHFPLRDTPKPQKYDYPSLMAYLKELAKWVSDNSEHSK